MTNDFRAAISGIYETHLSVTNLVRSVAFYRDVLGLELAREIPERGVAFFWAGRKCEGMLGLWQGGSSPLRMLGHFAFRMTSQAVLTAPEALKARGVAPLGFHGEPVSEPVVLGWMPAMAVYFKDPDGHSLEFIHVLDTPPDAAFGTGPLSDWRQAHPFDA